MKKFLPYILTMSVAMIIPDLALALGDTLRDIVSETIVPLIKGVIRIFYVSLAIGLSYGVVMYFIHSDDVKKREEIKGYLLWGVIGITVVFSLWGILAILSLTLGWWGDVGIPIIRSPA